MCHAAGIPAEKTKLIKPVYDDNDLCKLLLEKLVDDKLGVGGVKMNFFHKCICFVKNPSL